MDPFQFEIARFLAAKAKQGQRTTYQELADAVGWSHPTGRGLGKNLYAVLHYMHDMKVPPLTTILVRKGHRYPDDNALGYIRDAIGDIDIADAQEEVFSYDWNSVPELLSVSDGLPGGQQFWQASLKARSVADNDTGQNAFLLKFNGKLHGPKGISRPKRLEDWNDEVLRMPWEGSRASSRSDKSPGPKIAIGDLLYLWAHEHEDFGSGLGLTGVAKVKRVTEEDGFLQIQLGDLALLKHPFGFKLLGEEGWRSTILDRIKEDRHPRAWVMTADEQAEIDKVILVNGASKTEALAKVAHKHLSALDRALTEDRDAVLAAEHERKTTTVKARPEQQKFREEAMHRHAGRCVITGFKVSTVLEAAHVIPHTGNPAFEVPGNSLILRRDIHALFDARMIAINPKTGMLMVSAELKTTAYRKLKGKSIDHKLASESLSYQYAQFKKSTS